MTSTVTSRRLAVDRAGSESLTITVQVAGSFDDAYRVASMLRARRYDVRTLQVDVARDGSASVVADVAMPADGVPTLLARLDRMPVVLDARA